MLGANCLSKRTELGSSEARDYIVNMLIRHMGIRDTARKRKYSGLYM